MVSYGSVLIRGRRWWNSPRGSIVFMQTVFTGRHGFCMRSGIYGRASATADSTRLRRVVLVSGFSPQTESLITSSPVAMSCLDVMYHQSYGAHYLPSAAAYKAAYYRHHHQQQQRKPSGYNKMQECVDQQQQQQQQRVEMLSREQGLHRAPEAPGSSASNLSPKDGSQPAEAEYLSSRCVLFTYFQGEIGDVVDEHFSRALSQSSAFTREAKPIRVSQSSAGLWKDAVSISDGPGGALPTTVWNSAYPSQANPCLHSVSVHPDFSPSPVPFHSPADGALWTGHALSQAGLPPPPPPQPAALPDAWSFGLSPQSAGGYHPHIHDVYPHPHAHMHPRHPHAVLHSYPSHSAALDPRFGPLLLSGVRNQSQTSSSPGSHGSPRGEGIKTEVNPSSDGPVAVTPAAWPPSGLVGAMDIYDSALDQDKLKASVWF